MYSCPVCRYPGLDAKPYAIWPPPEGLELVPPYEDQLGDASYDVCVRCGFEFGFDDNPGVGMPDTFETYREKWVELGRPWLSDRWIPSDVKDEK